MNYKNREILEKKLEARKVKIFKDIHASGHARNEEHRELIKMLNPENIIPSHAGKKKVECMVKLAEEMGYKKDESIHVAEDGMTFEFQ